MKRLQLMAMTAVLTFGIFGTTVLAAPEKQKDGTIFDPVYYAVHNPDVLMVVGLDEKGLYNHYKTYGIAEGRLPFEGATPATAAALQANAGLTDPAAALAAANAANAANAAAFPAAGALPAAGTAAAGTPTGNPSEDVPQTEYGNYRLDYLSGAPATKAAYMANLINVARLNHRTDKYIHNYPFQWDRGLANAAQLKAEQYVYSRTNEKTVTASWYDALPQKYRIQTLVEIDVNGGGNPADIVGYWTAYWDGHYEEVEEEYEDEDGEKKTRKEKKWVEGRYIHESADMNKIFNHESRNIGVGHVESTKYNLKDYWVVLMGN